MVHPLTGLSAPLTILNGKGGQVLKIIALRLILFDMDGRAKLFKRIFCIY